MDCTTQPSNRRGTVRKVSKWGGIGCGGLLGLFILLIGPGLLVGPSPSEDGERTAASSQSVAAIVAPSEGQRPVPVPIPPSWTARDLYLAGTEYGENLANSGRKLDDSFVQDAVTAVESKLYGDAGNWRVTNSDMIAACDMYIRMGEAVEAGQPIGLDAFMDILQNEIGPRGTVLLGAIQSGIGETTSLWSPSVRYSLLTVRDLGPRLRPPPSLMGMI